MRKLSENKTALTIFAGVAVFIVGGAALGVYYPTYALLIAAAVFACLLLPFRKLYIVAATVTLPFSPVLAVGTPLGLIPISDLLAIGAIVSFWLSERWPGKDALPKGLARPVFIPLLLAIPYFFVAAMGVALGPGSAGALAQRIELVIVWLAFGALLFHERQINLFIKSFVITCTFLSFAWIATPGVGGVLGMQKNPSGGFISAALIMLVLSPIANKWRIPGIMILAGGLLSTGSRGSMLGLGVAVILMLLFIRQWKRIALPFIFAAGAGVLALTALPADVTSRILAQDNDGAYTIDIRGIFIEDALEQFRASPWEGIGIGNYVQTHPALQSILTHDPHNVYALTLAEGGYPLMVGFLILFAGSLLWLLGKRKTPLVALALAVQVSTLTHAYVDVYWVRGTPAPGLLLVGAAAAYLFSKRQGGTLSDTLDRLPTDSSARALPRR